MALKVDDVHLGLVDLSGQYQNAGCLDLAGRMEHTIASRLGLASYVDRQVTF
jgi:hypothetical protein